MQNNMNNLADRKACIITRPIFGMGRVKAIELTKHRIGER